MLIRVYIDADILTFSLVLFSQKLNMGEGPSNFDVDVPEGKSDLVLSNY